MVVFRSSFLPIPERATLVKPLKPGPYFIAMCLLKTPTFQMTAREIQEWLAEKNPQYQYKNPKFGIF